METNIDYIHSVIDEDKLLINDKELNFYVTDYYDGIKEETNLDENILLLWNNYNETHETWFQIKASDVDFLVKYLSNEIGILTLMKHSEISLVKRYYKTYNLLSKPLNIDLHSESIQFPEDDILIGQNLLKIIDNNVNYERVVKIKKEFSTIITDTIETVKSSNSVNFNLLGLAA